MKKLIRLVLILLAALALLFGALFLLKEEKPVPEVPADTTLISHTSETLRELSVSGSNGGFRLAIENGVGTLVPALVPSPVWDEGALKTAVSACRKIKYDTRIPDGEDRLSEFGLSPAVSNVTITLADGSTECFSIGSSVPGAETESRYLLWNNTVYTVYKTYLTPFLWDKTDFVSRKLTPKLNDPDRPVIPLSFSVQPRDGEAITVVPASSSTIGGYALTSYALTSPVFRAADTAAADALFTAFFGLSADAALFVSPGPEELNRSGLLDPAAVITLTHREADGEQKETVLYVSDKAASGGCFLTDSDHSAVWYMQTPPAAFYMDSCIPLLSREIPSLAVSAIEGVTLTDGSEKVYELTLIRDAEGKYTVDLNGNTIDTVSFRNFYYILISSLYDTAELSGGAPADGEYAELTVCYHGTDGTELTVMFTRFSDRRSAVYVNGVRGGELSVSIVYKVLNTLERLAAGEEIRAQY